MDMRQFDPALARWVVQDPVVHHSMSPYTGFDNNPVFWADPSGADATNLVQSLWDLSGDGKTTWTNNDDGTFSSSDGQTADCGDCGDENHTGDPDKEKVTAASTASGVGKGVISSIFDASLMSNPFTMVYYAGISSYELLTGNQVIPDLFQVNQNEVPGYMAGIIAFAILEPSPGGEANAVRYFIKTANGLIEITGKGFQSFSAFKRAMGAAGKGKAWHHIVEQHADNVSKFGAEAIHNTGNLIKLPHGAGTIHAKISGYYSSIQPTVTGSMTMTVRQWISKKGYKEQYEFGIQKLKDFGWTP